MKKQKRHDAIARHCLLLTRALDIRDTFRQMAAALNLELLCLDKAAEAPEPSGRSPARCVIIDVRGSDNESIEALHLFRSSGYAKVPVLVLTEDDTLETVNRYTVLGANACLRWPANSDNVTEALRHLIGRATSDDGPAEPSRSLSAMSTWRRFIVAVFLISVLPVLALIALLVNPDQGITLIEDAPRAVLMINIMFMVFGYGLLVTYPINVIRLRKYLEAMARGSIPEKVDLMKEENDLAAIEACMKTVVTQTQERVKTLESQTQALIQAEQQRVMLESFGAACHHLGQPATIIDLYLAMIELQITDPELKDMIKKCQESSKEIANILRKLQTRTHYQTEYYRPREEEDLPRPDERIIKL